MPSPFIKEKEDARASNVGFVELEKGGPAGPTVAEIVSALVRTDQQPWRFDFRSGALNTTEDWTLVQQGAGHSVDAGTGNLVIGSGVTINTETILRSKRRFTLPVRTSVALMLSQRIANQEFYVELVNGAGDVFTRWKFDGTTATSGKIETASGSLAANRTLDVTVTVPTTASAGVLEIDLAMDEVSFRTRTPDSAAFGTDRSLRTSNLPHPDDELYLQIRVKNLGTAPATNTNLTVYSGWVQDVNELAVELVGGRGNTGQNNAIPVSVQGNPVLGASTNRTGFNAAGATWQQTSITAQAASATVTGTARDLYAVASGSALNSSGSFAKEYRGLAISDVAGTLNLEISVDNVTWRRIMAIPTTTNGTGGLHVAQFQHMPVTRYARVVYVNGGTLQAHFTLAEAYFSL
jgi:hypothetical protein